MVITEHTLSKIKSNLPKGAEFVCAKYTDEKRDNHVNYTYVYENVEVIYMYMGEKCRTIFAKKGGFVR